MVNLERLLQIWGFGLVEIARQGKVTRCQPLLINSDLKLIGHMLYSSIELSFRTSARARTLAWAVVWLLLAFHAAQEATYVTELLIQKCLMLLIVAMRRGADLFIESSDARFVVQQRTLYLLRIVFEFAYRLLR